jgi:hypothetical protein
MIMTRFELYYGGIDIDIDRVSAMRCPMPHQVNIIHELKDEDDSCLSRKNPGLIDGCKMCWEKKLDWNDLPEVSYVLAHRYSDLGLTMIDFVHIGGIMLSNDCTFEEALYRYHKRLDACIGKE